jgi:hypothetical protein
MIRSRKMKLHEADPVRQLLLCSQQWKELVADFKNYHNVWGQLRLRFGSNNQKGKVEGQVIEGLLGKFLLTRRKVV